MHNIRISQVYARIFFEKAKASNAVVDVLRDFELLNELVSKSVRVGRVLEAPIYPLSVKKNLLTIAAKKLKMNNLSQALIELLLKDNSICYLGGIYKIMMDLSIASEGRTSAKLISASEMSAKELEQSQAKLEKVFAKKFVITHEVDSRILGGVILKFDSMMYDASVLGAMNKMRNYLREIV